MFEIKVLYRAHVGCTGRQGCAPGCLSMCSILYEGIDMLEKVCTPRVHRCQNCSFNISYLNLMATIALDKEKIASRRSI